MYLPRQFAPVQRTTGGQSSGKERFEPVGVARSIRQNVAVTASECGVGPSNLTDILKTGWVPSLSVLRSLM
jgi:hypothetical protein